MADGDRWICLKFVEKNVQIGAANPRRIHLDYNLLGDGLRFWDIQYVYVPGSTRSFTYRKHKRINSRKKAKKAQKLTANGNELTRIESQLHTDAAQTASLPVGEKYRREIASAPTVNCLATLPVGCWKSIRVDSRPFAVNFCAFCAFLRLFLFVPKLHHQDLIEI